MTHATANRRWWPAGARRARRAAGLSLEDLRLRLAERLGDAAPSAPSLWRWERGGAHAPHPLMWPELARAMRCSLRSLTRRGSGR